MIALNIFIHLNWRVLRLIQFDVTVNNTNHRIKIALNIFIYLNWRMLRLIKFNV